MEMTCRSSLQFSSTSGQFACALTIMYGGYISTELKELQPALSVFLAISPGIFGAFFVLGGKNHATNMIFCN